MSPADLLLVPNVAGGMYVLLTAANRLCEDGDELGWEIRQQLYDVCSQMRAAASTPFCEGYRAARDVQGHIHFTAPRQPCGVPARLPNDIGRWGSEWMRQHDSGERHTADADHVYPNLQPGRYGGLRRGD